MKPIINSFIVVAAMILLGSVIGAFVVAAQDHVKQYKHTFTLTSQVTDPNDWDTGADWVQEIHEFHYNKDTTMIIHVGDPAVIFRMVDGWKIRYAQYNGKRNGEFMKVGIFKEVETEDWFVIKIYSRDIMVISAPEFRNVNFAYMNKD